MKDSPSRRLRRAGLAAAIVAVCAGVAVAGCASSVSGNPQANQQDLSEYQAEATSSSQAASSSSRAANAARAKTSACGAYTNNRKPQQDAHNAFVKAIDNNEPDAAQKRQAAVTAHNNAISQINSSLSQYSGSLSPSIATALRNYVDATRGLLTETERIPPSKDGLNGSLPRMRTATQAATSVC